MDKISIIIPCYNEELTIPYLKTKLDNVLIQMSKDSNVSFEILMIDNSSTDNTLNLMKDLSKEDDRFKYISFSRNFGKDSSMYAGLKYSTGDYVTIMDADLQDPPELLSEMYDIIKKEDYDIIATYRKNRKGEPFFRSLFAKFFYFLMSKISNYEIVSGARDFRLMKRKVVDAFLSLEESERFTKGIFSWVGFKTKWIPFDNVERVAGNTKLPMSSAIKYAFSGIVSFSTFPLVLSSVLGVTLCIITFIYTIFVIVKQIMTHEAVSGYTSTIVILLFGFGITWALLGIIGQYIAQSYLEIKHRPKFIIKETNLNV